MWVRVVQLWSMALWLALAVPAAAFDVQGHRGARGYLPENTLAGFERALLQGATTLETDLALTRDDVLVLTHDPRPNPDLVRGPAGDWLPAVTPPIRALSLAQVQSFDVGRLRPGSRYAEQWATQEPRDGSRIPTLAELLAMPGAARAHFNIETKLSPLRPDETADPDTFAAAVVAAVRAAGVADRVSVQSFDWRTLRAVQRMAPNLPTVCLTVQSGTSDTLAPVAGSPSPWLAGIDPAAHGGSVPRTVHAAGCRAWSPFWRNVTAETIQEAKALGLPVVPWTVNDAAEMDRLIGLGVDGLISDYPDRAVAAAGRAGKMLAPLVLGR